MTTRALIGAIEKALDTEERPLHLHEPCFGGRELELVKHCIDTGWVSSAGPFVEQFEKELAQRCGVAHAVAAVSGTAALHLAFILAGVERDDEVLIPTLTFVATANAVTYCGAIPHFVDSEERSLGIDAEKLRHHLKKIASPQEGKIVNRETGRVIRAVVPVHVFGHPVDLDALTEVCNEFGLPLIEDATEALGSLYKGRACGGFGMASVFSFNGNKIVTTGGGGAVLTNDPAVARRAKHISTTAKQPHKWAFWHDEIGFNYRLPNLNAALGVAQLQQLDGFIAAKRRLAERYAVALDGVSGARFVREPDGTQSIYWLNAILLDDDSGAGRDEMLQATHDVGLFTRPVWTPMHELPMFDRAPRDDVSVAESISRRLVNLPSSAKLGGERAGA